MSTFPTIRLRRLRQNDALRAMVRETRLDKKNLMLPLFVRHGGGDKTPISSMPGHFQLTLDHLQQEIQEVVALGIPGVMLFGVPEKKDGIGSDSCNEHGIIAEALRICKKVAPELVLMADVCLCEYTDHAHCGVIDDNGVDNDKTLAVLAKQAVNYVKAGADVIAPSGMMDGMVTTLRAALDQAHYSHIPILSYAAKFCSGFYGPFREAVDSTPRFGDRQAYQMDPANGREALREVELDVAEGADMLMIKPAMSYLDVIANVKQRWPGLPLSAYQVSGEFAMIKAAAERGWIDEKRVVLESLISIRRAGADFIFTYFAKEVAPWL